MKRNFLKTSLSAFAFTLAIIASFAFSPALNDAEDLLPPPQGYIQQISPLNCAKVDHDCLVGDTFDCTVTLISGEEPVFGDTNPPANTTCDNRLSKPIIP